MDHDDHSCPIRRQMIPGLSEWDSTGGFPDPLKEGVHSPVPGIVHVYPDRVAVIVTGKCATRCRFCLRRWMLTEPDLDGERLDRVIGYLRENVEIRDVLLTGGDPFMLDDQVIENLLVKFRAIPHIDIIRFGTRTISTLTVLSISMSPETKASSSEPIPICGNAPGSKSVRKYYL